MVEIHILGLDEQLASQTVTQINQRLQTIHNDWHAWKPGQLDQLNAAISQGDPFLISQDLANGLRQAAELESLSGGLFNPAIGGLIGTWGFHTDDFPITSPPPDQSAIDLWLNGQASSGQVAISEDGAVQSTNPLVQFDLGGYAKGLAVDDAISLLKHAGANAALVNAGGDLRAYGKPNQRDWRVAVRHPVNGDVLAIVEVDGDEAIFTSGNYARFKEFEGKRFAHILDPRTGRPVDHIASATVIASSGAIADAAATALVVAGDTNWTSVAKRMGVQHALLIDERGCIYADSDMLKRIHFPNGKPDCVHSASFE